MLVCGGLIVKCCICGKEIVGFGNNPYPLRDAYDDTSRCCDECNWDAVLPARLLNLKRNKKVEVIDDNA